MGPHHPCPIAGRSSARQVIGCFTNFSLAIEPTLSSAASRRSLDAPHPRAPAKSANMEYRSSSISSSRRSAARHGREVLQHGFTLDPVVHDYGDLCQAIMELAADRRASIGVDEFRTLNRCLDNAIAEAAVEFTTSAIFSVWCAAGRARDGCSRSIRRGIHRCSDPPPRFVRRISAPSPSTKDLPVNIAAKFRSHRNVRLGTMIGFLLVSMPAAWLLVMLVR
jgi:hypothetical protein